MVMLMILLVIMQMMVMTEMILMEMSDDNDCAVEERTQMLYVSYT